MSIKKNKKIFMVTLGCDKNKVDSEIMLKSLVDEGFEICSDEDQADCIIINSCGFLKSATEESLELFFEANAQKKIHSGKKVVLAGCLPSRYWGQKMDLRQSLPEADLITKGSDAPNMGRLLREKLFADSAPSLLKKSNIKNKPDYLKWSEATRLHEGYAFIKISEGCNLKCSFCTIPLIRGRQKSIAESELLRIARQKVKLGLKELILVSQDTARYGRDLVKPSSLLELAGKMAKIPGLRWLRFLYLNPQYLSQDFLEFVAREKCCVKYLDIPLQHVSGAILKKMRRQGDEKKYGNLIKKIRKTIPEVRIRSSFIIGFPGETEEDFAKLKNFIREHKLDRIGFFLYSDEEGSEAYDFKDKVGKKIAQKRLAEVMEIQKKISEEKLKELVGQKLAVLVENEEKGEYIGRTQWDAPEVDGQVFIVSSKKIKCGSIVKVEITGSLEYDLLAEHH